MVVKLNKDAILCQLRKFNRLQRLKLAIIKAADNLVVENSQKDKVAK